MRTKVGSSRVVTWSHADLVGDLQSSETASTRWNPTAAPRASFFLCLLLWELHSLDPGSSLILEVSLRNLN